MHSVGERADTHRACGRTGKAGYHHRQAGNQHCQIGDDRDKARINRR
jgi:hypothetical protein